MAGADAVVAVLQHQAVVNVHPDAPGRFQKNGGVRLAFVHIIAADHIVEIAGGAGGLQIAFNHGFGAGAGHNAGQVNLLQILQQFLQPRLAGNAPVKLLIPVAPDLLQQFPGRAAIEFGNVRPQAVPRQAAAAAVKRLRRVGQTQFAAAGNPEGVPDALGIKHQTVHIKNDALHFRCHGKDLTIHKMYGFIVPQNPTARNDKEGKRQILTGWGLVFIALERYNKGILAQATYCRAPGCAFC